MRTRKTLLATGAVLMLAPAAYAADAVLEVPTPPVEAAPVALPVDMWTGPYVGAFGGWSTGTFDSSAGDIDADGFEGGVFAGFNQQIGTFVYGVEGDIGYSGVDGTLGGTTVEANKDWFGSLRGRAGVAFDPVLIYGTAGLAVTQAEVTAPTGSDSNTHLGWTVGAGADVAVTDNVFGRLEYRYSDYQSEDFNLGAGTVVSSGFDEHTIRAGIGLKF